MLSSSRRPTRSSPPVASEARSTSTVQPSTPTPPSMFPLKSPPPGVNSYPVCCSLASIIYISSIQLTSFVAPVFGASPMAESGKLIFVVAGPSTATQRIAPYLKDVMGRSVISMGPTVSQSALLKIAGNICVVSFMEVISEAHVFAEKTGLGSPILENMIADMFGPVLESYSKRLTTGAYAPEVHGKAGFDVSLAMKDARHALNCAEKVGARLEVSEVALRHMEEAARYGEEIGGRALDSSSMYGTIRRDAGLDFYTDLCKERDAR